MNSDKNNDEEILIVEDSPTQAEMLKFLLEKHDYRVWVAYNGREALDMITKKGTPALVISDIVMPEMDGYELCRHIKEEESLKEIPVILLTALSDSRDVLKGLECGADNFITKPYDEKYILSRVQYMLANRKIHEREKMEMGIKMFFGGQEYYITAARQQILDLLISTYETALWKNIELQKVQDELRSLNEELEKKVEERTASLRAEVEVRRRTEEELHNVNRAIKTLSEGNRALVRSTDESELLHRLCRIIVEMGGYLLAWIGFAEHNEKKSVRPAAQYGYEEGYLETLNITWADTEKGQVGKAIRTRKPQIVKNIMTRPDYISLRAEAIRRGYASSLIIPFTINTQLVGVLNIYAKEPDAFDEEEVNLLAEMANDLAFGVKALRMRAERDRAEDALKESEERYRTIIEYSNSMIWTIDREGRFLFFNKFAEEVSGHKLDDWRGKSFAPLIKKEDLPKIMELSRKILEGEPQQYEVNIMHKSGSVMILSVNSAPMYSKGKIVGTVSFGRDITEQKKMEELRLENLRLEAADKAKSEFLANMSHELRTPLNAVIGFSELIKQGMTGKLNEKQEHFINNINASGTFLLSLINDILDLSKIEAGKVELVVEKISVPVTIKETLVLIKEKAAKHNVNLNTELASQLKFIEADKQRFKQILFNLLSNAVKFSKLEGGTVTITAKKEGGVVKFSVSDTGIGIKQENMEKLFHKFEQLEPEIANKYGGTGLGLAISKQLVELHGGKIWAESKYGEGSTFTFTLPVEVKKG